MRIILSLVLAAHLAAVASAETIVLRHDTAGADFDCIIDGFPGQFGARDGTPDTGDFPLSGARATCSAASVR